MSSHKLRSLLLGPIVCVAAIPAFGQTTVTPGSIQNIPPGAIFVNPTGQDTFVSGGSNQSVTQAPTAQGGVGGEGGRGGRGGTGGGAVVTNNNTVNSVPGSGGGNYPSTIRNTPSSTLALATAYCQNNAGIAGSGAGFSFSAAAGKHDIDCKRLNYGMLLSSLGMTQEAVLVIANNEEVNKAIWEAHHQREAAAVAQPVASRPVAQRRSSMNPASNGDPRPSARQCDDMRSLSNPSQLQLDYVSANCS